MDKKEHRVSFSNLPIRMVLMISLFPFVILLLFCCVSFYGSGVRQYTQLVKNNAEAVVDQCRNSLDQDLANIEYTVSEIQKIPKCNLTCSNWDAIINYGELVEKLQMFTMCCEQR